jgi:hypothetical protein
VDSVTSHRSVAADVAQREGVPNLRRDVFLDDDLGAQNLQNNFQELISIARRKGSALAIGHPHPETIALLRTQLPRLNSLGVRLVSVPQLLRIRGDSVEIKGSEYLNLSNALTAHMPKGSSTLTP